VYKVQHVQQSNIISAVSVSMIHVHYMFSPTLGGSLSIDMFTLFSSIYL